MKRSSFFPTALIAALLTTPLYASASSNDDLQLPAVSTGAPVLVDPLLQRINASRQEAEQLNYYNFKRFDLQDIKQRYGLDLSTLDTFIENIDSRIELLRYLEKYKNGTITFDDWNSGVQRRFRDRLVRFTIPGVSGLNIVSQCLTLLNQRCFSTKETHFPLQDLGRDACVIKSEDWKYINQSLPQDQGVNVAQAQAAYIVVINLLIDVMQKTGQTKALDDLNQRFKVTRAFYDDQLGLDVFNAFFSSLIAFELIHTVIIWSETFGKEV